MKVLTYDKTFLLRTSSAHLRLLRRQAKKKKLGVSEYCRRRLGYKAKVR